MVKETINKPSELVINEQPVTKLGKKVKLTKTEEFKHLTYNELLTKINIKKELQK